MKITVEDADQVARVGVRQPFGAEDGEDDGPVGFPLGEGQAPDLAEASLRDFRLLQPGGRCGHIGAVAEERQVVGEAFQEVCVPADEGGCCTTPLHPCPLPEVLCDIHGVNHNSSHRHFEILRT
jgi:hypothetical protein